MRGQKKLKVLLVSEVDNDNKSTQTFLSLSALSILRERALKRILQHISKSFRLSSPPVVFYLYFEESTDFITYYNCNIPGLVICM
jgi:hypothetical protein